MKTTINFILIISILALTSCRKDEEIKPDLEQDIPENYITTPCEFDASSLEANSTVNINCLLDLKGETVSLPKNINFDFEGGDIVNGKLIFSGGYIDGRLLSSKLEVEGNVHLKDSIFNFYSSRWEIIEGPTSSEIALENNSKLESLMFKISELGGRVFKINKFDAYFEVTKVTSSTSNKNWYPSLEAVNLPDNFTLQMTENTHLRIFPGDKYNREGGAILAVRDGENIVVKGGNLHGDRDERVYSPDDNGLEGSHLFIIHSGRNITVDGVNFQNGSKGTFTIHSFGFSYNDDYNPTEKVVIKNCSMKNSRRMAIALTDGRDIRIEGNTFTNTGHPSPNSDGGEVGYAINIEPVRFRDNDGILKERQKVFDVLIKGNTETGSRGGFLTLTISQDVTVEDNNIGSRLVYNYANGTVIKNNQFSAMGTAADSWAIFCAGSGETVFNNEVFDNNIKGYKIGIVVGSNEAYVHNNEINNCSAGIQVNKAFDAKIHNNKINATGNGIQISNTYNNNVEVKGNTVHTTGNYNLYVTNSNTKDEHKSYKISFIENSFTSTKKVILSNTNGVTFSTNKVEGGIELNNINESLVTANEVKPNESDGIRIIGATNNLTVSNNSIFEPTGAERYVCINNDSDTPNGVNLSNNACNP